MTRSIVAALLALCAIPCGAAEEIHSVLPAVATICVHVPGGVEVDGDLSDAAWGRAASVSGFTISGADMLAPNQTEFRVLRDDEALYLGVRCLEENMQGLKTDVTTRDGSVWHDDVIEMFFDVDHDHDSFYQLAVNAIATRFDARSGSRTWDADWEAEASIGPESWAIEVRVPFASLNTDPPEVGEVWGLNVCRERLAEGSGNRVLHNWSNVQGNFLRPWLFGHLYFAGEQFQLTDDVAREIHGRIEVPARVYLTDELALIGPEGVEERLTYQGMLARAFGEAGRLHELHADLASAYREHPDAPFRDEFEPLNERFEHLRGLAETEEAISSVQWAHQTIQISRLTTELRELTWKVKIALLLSEA